MSRVPIQLNVNGQAYPLEVESHRTLLEVLRDELALTGTKSNCQEGECGACTVMVEGRPVNACLYLAVRASGQRVTTIEGLASRERLHLVQQAFVQHGGVQCGYCTPGFIVAAAALLAARPRPTEEELARALAGNLCRCTGYVNIRRALRAAIEAGSPA